jgi:hypothetical protein
MRTVPHPEPSKYAKIFRQNTSTGWPPVGSDTISRKGHRGLCPGVRNAALTGQQ